MKINVRMLGATIIAIAAFFLLFKILNNITYEGRTGIYEILGGEIEDNNNVSEDAYSEGSTSAFKAYASRTIPVLSYASFDQEGNWQRIKAGTSVTLLDFFKGTDADGNQVSEIIIEDITDEEGNSFLESYDETTGTITFSTAGIYTLTCYMKDCENLEATSKVDFPVDN